MLGIQRHLGLLVLTSLGLLLALAVCVAALQVGSAGGSSPPDSTAAPQVPEWFLPIWDAYDRNPAITPGFDFASLYNPTVQVPMGARR